MTAARPRDDDAPLSNEYDQACRALVRLSESSAAAVRWLTGSGVRFVEWVDARRVAWPGESDRTGDCVAWVQDPGAGGARST
ncbi:MAG: hypothetical protein ACRC33_22245, partial [Gemmataceae bacterium]